MAPLGQLAALGEDAVWERAPGATLADWAASPYSAEFAAETRTTERDQPVLWLAWSSEQARRVSRLMGWLHLVANGHATGRVMPLAPLVARVLQDASREQAVGLLWQFCSLFEGRALEPEAAHRLFNDGWLPLLRSAAPPRALVVYLARIAGTHNVRRRGVAGLGALQLEAPLLKRMQKLHDDHPSSEFMALTDKDAHALILALIASPEREAAGAWALEHWRILPVHPPRASVHVQHDAMWSEPTAGYSLAALLTQAAPPPTAVLRLLCTPAHRVRATRTKWFAGLAQKIGVSGSWEGNADAEGFVALPRELSLEFLYALCRLPAELPGLAGLFQAVIDAWRPAVLAAPESPVWVDCPGSFLSTGRSQTWWGEHRLFEVLTTIEVEARGPKCRWNGLTASHLAFARTLPLAREGLEWLWPERTLPLLCDRNAEAIGGAFFREALATPIDLTKALEKTNGHGSMELEANLHQ